MTTDTDDTLTAELTEAFRRLGLNGRQAQAAARGRDYQPLTQLTEVPRGTQPDPNGHLTQMTETATGTADESQGGADKELTDAFRMMGLSESAAKEAARGR